MRVFDFNQAIVRTPDRNVVNGLRAEDHGDPSFDVIVHEHTAYVQALKNAGLNVTELPNLPDYPDSIFVEDPALVFTDVAIVLKPGAASREGEAAHLAPTFRDLFADVIELPEGYADGGDVLVTRDRVYIGLSSRTDERGARALVDILARFGRAGTILRTPPSILHLKTGASLVDEETILMTDVMAASGLFDGMRILTVPNGEERAANALRLNDTILISNGNPKTQDLLAKSGYRIVPLDTAEVGKIDAGLTCMSLRWWS